MSAPTSLLDWALDAVARGFFVFHLQERSKTPYPRTRGFLDATKSPDLIRKIWTRSPRANIGIACEASGILVIDIDGRNDGPATARALPALPDSWRVLTSDGDHTYLRCPPNLQLRGTLGDGIVHHRA